MFGRTSATPLLALEATDIVAVDKGMESANVFVHSIGAGSEKGLPDPTQLRSRKDELIGWFAGFKARKKLLLN